jgi:hypothetical protein
MKALAKILLAGSLAMVVLAACGGRQKQPIAGTTDYPDWVTRGSGAFSGDQSKVFYGVGSVSGGGGAVKIGGSSLKWKTSLLKPIKQT